MIILKDTREQKGWDFKYYSAKADVFECKLDTGDYTVEGIESDFVIERKASVGEFAKNLTSKSFHRELERMKSIEHSFLIFEFSWRDIEIFPVNSGIPRRLWNQIRVKPNFIFSSINRYRLDYGIHCIACSSEEFAERTAYDLMKRYYENKFRSN